MRIGVGAAPATVDKAVDETRRAHEAGFPGIWFSNIFSLDAMTACATAGRAVEGIEVGTAVVPTYSRHPFAMAQQALGTHDACGGRFTLGVGLSHRVVVENLWGLSFEKPVLHAREYLTVLRSLFDEGTVNHQGEVYRVQGTIERPRGEAPQLVVAALREQMLRVAGALADGTILWMAGPRTIADHIVPGITKAAEEGGRAQPRVIASLPVCLTSDPDAAREAAAQMFETYGQLPSYKAMLDREGASGPADVAIVGDESELTKGIDRMRDAGVTDFNAAVFGDDRKRTFDFLAARSVST